METTNTRRSYFGGDSVKRHTMSDDPASWVEVKIMTEGDRAKYDSDTKSEMKVTQQKETFFSVDSGIQRAALVRHGVKSWNFVDADGSELPVNRGVLDRVLKEFPPAVIDEIAKAVTDANPWLKGERSVEDIDAEIERLEEEREEVKAREEGNES